MFFPAYPDLISTPTGNPTALFTQSNKTIIYQRLPEVIYQYYSHYVYISQYDLEMIKGHCNFPEKAACVKAAIVL